ncbi:OmpA family protein [Granulosicoccus sp. 3-233]|uniref:OmpA family protein n=1 Tax=Granulosicoccus sp. 3-233 TaxID=3417969 RepID=UPI003D330BC5
MSAHTLHFNLPDAERPSIWPWLVVLLGSVCLVVLIARSMTTIPASLLHQAQEKISAAGFSDMNVAINGRDLELTGSIDQRLSVALLLEQLREIQGVRIVRDNMTRFDPVETELQQTRLFLQALARIDTSSVAFQQGSNTVTPGSDIALNQVAELLRSNPEKRLRIEGHTDNTGPDSVNLRLSQERAEAVVRYLEARNVSPNQLIAKGYGATQPIADNASETGRARNRRIEISYVD